jgi:hypothetical protein
MAEHFLDNDFSKVADHLDSKSLHGKLMDDVLLPNLIADNKPQSLADHLKLNDLIQPQDALSPRAETHSAAALTDSVVREFGAGMYSEVKEHPYRLGIEAGVAAAATLGTMMTWNPRLHAALEIAGSLYGIYQVGKGALHLADQAAVIADKNSSQTAIDLANQNIRSMGASTTEVLALTAGGALAMGGLGAAVNVRSEFLAPSNISSGLNSSFRLIAANNFLVPNQVSSLVGNWVNGLDAAKR